MSWVHLPKGRAGQSVAKQDLGAYFSLRRRLKPKLKGAGRWEVNCAWQGRAGWPSV